VCGLASFLESRAVPLTRGGGFTVCEGGEVDTRGCYTALASADLAGLDAPGLASRAGILPFLAACQTPEGGLAGAPGGEAHGGYTLCGLGAALLAAGVRGGEGRASEGASAAVRAALDLRRLAVWAARCQSPAAGGFSGRTGKLVDGCYSYWQGAVFPLLEVVGGGVPGPRVEEGAEGVGPPVTRLPPLPGPPPLPRGMSAPPGPVARAASTAAAAAATADAAEARLADAATADLAAAAAAARAAAGWAVTGAAAAAAGALALSALDPSWPATVPTPPSPALFNAPALVAWVRACCQAPPPRGGLRDKPGAPPDFYHTCYCLSGLAAVDAVRGGSDSGSVTPDPTTGGDWRLARADPLLNVTAAAVARWRAREEERG